MSLDLAIFQDLCSIHRSYSAISPSWSHASQSEKSFESVMSMFETLAQKAIYMRSEGLQAKRFLHLKS